MTYKEAISALQAASYNDFLEMIANPRAKIMRRLIAGEPASVHNGLLHISNCCNQGVVKGHTQEDLKWLNDNGFVKITDNKYGFQDIEVTPKGMKQYATKETA